MLFGILKHFDSLRELEIGMKAEAHKLGHLGMSYLVRRSTLAEANVHRPQEFFASVYAYLLEKKLFDNILKGVINAEGIVTHIDQKVRFTRGELIHEARRVEIFYETKKPVVLLTNNFDFTVEDIAEIYRLRWAIESLYKLQKIPFAENGCPKW